MHLFLNLLLNVLLILFFTINSRIFRILFLLLRLATDRRKVCLFFSWVWSAIGLFLFSRLLLFYLLFFSLFFFSWVDSWIIWHRNGRWLLLDCAAFILYRFLHWITIFDILKTFDLLHVVFGKLVLDINTFILLLINLIQHFVHLRVILQTICISESV